MRQNWQARAFSYYALVPELNYAARFYERPLSKIDLRAEELVEGEWTPVEELDTNPQRETVLRVQSEFHDKDGSDTSLKGGYGKLSFLNGDMYLANLWDEDTDQAYWSVLSKFELQPAEGGWRWYCGPGSGDYEELQEPTEGSAVGPGMVAPYRLWTPDAQYRMQADAPARVVLDDCETLLTMSLTIRATGRSRASKGGILYLNSRLLPTTTRPPDQRHPYLDQLDAHLTAGIEDPEDVASLLPFILTGGLPANEAMSHVDLGAQDAYRELDVIEKIVNRMARGLDMPAEVLLGMGNVNHWTGWLISDEAWSHVEPVAQRMVGDYTQVYLHPRLEAEGIANPGNFRIGYDSTPAVADPDRGTNADEAHDRGAISDVAYRDAKGFDESDAPGPDAPNSNPRVLAVLAGASPPSAGDTPAGSTDVTEGPPPEVASAANVALHRCREAAGNRLRNIMKKHPNVYASVKNVDSENIPRSLGRDLVESHLNGESNSAYLVSGSSSCFARAMRDRLSPGEIAHYRHLIEAHAAATLYEDDPGPVPL